MSTGPRSVTPIMPAVLVDTPSIGLDPVSTSSTYTAGARYSGMAFSLLADRQVQIGLVQRVIGDEFHLDMGGGTGVLCGDFDFSGARDRRQPVIAVGVAGRAVDRHAVIGVARAIHEAHL